MACPCGCGRAVPDGQKYAARGCNLRAIPMAVRAERSRQWAKAHPGAMRAAGRKGGWMHRQNRWEDLMDRWLGNDGLKDPRGALVEAYRRGFGCGYQAGKRAVGVRYGRKGKAA